MFSSFRDSDFRVLPPVVDQSFNFWGGVDKRKVKEKSQPLDLKRFWRGVVCAAMVGASISASANEAFIGPSKIFNESVVASFGDNHAFLKARESIFNLSLVSEIGLNSPRKINSADEFSFNFNRSSGTALVPKGADFHSYLTGVLNSAPVQSDSTLVKESSSQNASALTAMSALVNLSAHTKDVVGANGTKRLQKFSLLRDGWDGADTFSMRHESVAVFDRFFSIEQFSPFGVSVFLSPHGNVVANWHSSKGLVELEFVEDGAKYFFDNDLAEGFVSKMNFGDFRRTLV